MDEVETKFLANFQILGPLGCQGWVCIPQNVQKNPKSLQPNVQPGIWVSRIIPPSLVAPPPPPPSPKQTNDRGDGGWVLCWEHHSLPTGRRSVIPVSIDCQALDSSVTVLRQTLTVSLLEIWTSKGLLFDLELSPYSSSIITTHHLWRISPLFSTPE